MPELKNKDSTKELESAYSDETRTGSNFNAFLSVVCMIAGAGTLGMPYSFGSAGWVSIFFIFLSGVISWHTGVLLIECIYHKPGQRLKDYPSIGEAAFGRSGRIFVQIFHYSIMLGVATLFIMLSGKNLHKLASKRNVQLEEAHWIFISGAAVLIPYVTLKTMKEVAWVSILGVATTFITVVISCIVGLIDLPNQPNHSHEFINLTGVPVSLATIGFSFGGTVIYTHVEASMRQPKKWPIVLAYAMASVSIMYLAVGIVGYYVYGVSVQTPILDSLPKAIPQDITYVIITLHLIAAAPLPLTSFSQEMESLWNIERFSPSTELFVRSVARILVVIPLTLIAAYLPFFGDFMALLGAVSNLVLVYITPVLCHLQLFGWKNRSMFSYIALSTCLLMGFFGGAWGAVDAVREIVKKSIVAHTKK